MSVKSIPALERRDLVTQVTQSLSETILSGKLEPGSRLNEVRLAEQFDISRAPLREALRRLETEGLVIAHARRGFFVRTINAIDIIEIFEVRRALEASAGRKVCANLAKQDLKLLEKQYERMKKSALDADFVAQIEADLGFHRLICQLSGNKRLLDLFDQISNEIRFAIVHLQILYEDNVALAQSHAPLLQAIQNKSEEEYVEALSLHLDEAREMLVTAFENSGLNSRD